ncbi:uncharacterized protein MYCFIDRAFT_148338 [Pseudocercospora fijiensis CIRAD86]|uniref:Cytochrome b561 domain-containing protein n=1 Tax=Pseudocercospora fijiensis (strain CIRAD86) TaxID=383855 RepID=N1Q674_PSEFD|nr:uncharacterized protein MYCFIDRAFT_148338 [Pseudocercospora fijiensis CIRAD86]EME87699.1 hypothetical protein MYCFIDRAFT_148338 [Pseudocercospora fijiensis CIRAD86]
MAHDGLSTAGTSVYDSNTMYVGDGTWDSERNTFLLPNLLGLNFDTMRYNGMGNRFRGLPQYHRLIIGHGVVAAITFLAIVPAAIFFARFYHAEGRFAYKAHVYLQIITVFLATVVFILGFFAVGPERSLSNPHHGIGVAIYVSILVQFIYGWWWSRRERKRTRPHPTIPLKTWEHESEMDEKWDDRPPQQNTWRDRIIGAGAGIAAFQGVKSLFGGKKKRKDGYAESDVSYQPGRHSMVSQTDVSRVEAGQAPFSPNDPRRKPRPLRSDMTPATPTRPGRRTSQSSLSYDDEYSHMGPRPVSGEGPSLRDSIATMGAIAGFREWNKRRKDRNERQRLDRIRQQELESEEQYNRRNSNRYPRPQDASGRRQSLSGTIWTGPDPALGSNPQLSRTNFRPDINQPPLPATAGAIPISPSPKSLSPSRRGGRRDSRSRIPGARRGSTSASISQLDPAGLPPVGGVPENSQSPPVSVKMKVHPGGRHVTLRRLNEEEAAAERAARRRERRSRRASSLTDSVDEAVAGSSRYRRNNGAQMRDSSQQPIAAVPPPPPAMSSSVGRRDSELNLPPGRIPQASSAGGSAQAVLPAAAGPAGSGAVGSPGTVGGGTELGTGTDVSAFADNRRRRRAERARKLEASRQGNRVEFE